MAVHDECSACGHAEQPTVPLCELTKYLCSTCAIVLANKILSLDDRTVSSMWRVARLPTSGRDAIPRLSEDLHKAETYADLAIAFLEMETGLWPDALENALISIRLDPNYQALTVVFGEKLRIMPVDELIKLAKPD